jgi:exodeoxyribonuclease VII small subunit
MGTSKSKAVKKTAASEMPSFESALEELETIVLKLENDDLSLDDALVYFERGISLMRVCDRHLNHAKGKISELLQGEDGEFVENVIGLSLESFLTKESTHE